MQKLSKADIQKIQGYFASQKDVLAVYLYGSFAKGTTHPRSDVDFGILFDGKVDLYSRLGQIYSDLCDLKLPVELDVRELNLTHPPLFLFNVIQGQLLFSRNELKKNEFEVAVLRQYYDTQRLRDLRYDYMQKRLREGTYGY